MTKSMNGLGSVLGGKYNSISCKSVLGKVKCYVFIVSSKTCIFVLLLYLYIIMFINT